MNEIWKDIHGYEGLYQVSNLGRVKRLSRIVDAGNGARRTLPEMIMSFRENKLGYHYVGLTKNHKQKIMLIHRLVASAFLENVQNKPEVNHIDGVKANNSVSNLDWCTRQENKQHANRTGLWKVTEKMKQRSRKVEFTNDQGESIQFNSVKEASEIFGVDRRWLFRVLRGQRNLKTVKGYKVRYI